MNIHIYTYVKISIIGYYWNLYSEHHPPKISENFQQKVSFHLFHPVASEMCLAQASNNCHCCKGCYRLEGNTETYGYLWLMTIYGYMTRSHHIIRFCESHLSGTSAKTIRATKAATPKRMSNLRRLKMKQKESQMAHS